MIKTHSIINMAVVNSNDSNNHRSSSTIKRKMHKITTRNERCKNVAHDIANLVRWWFSDICLRQPKRTKAAGD
jgi:hypothetical protein